MTYVVTLKAGQSVPDAIKRIAEDRYKAMFENRLGGAENVPMYYRAFINAANATADTIPKDEAEHAATFMLAHNAAEKAGLEGLQAYEGAHFAVRLS